MGTRRELDRGVITLQAQMRELHTDLAELKGETRAWQQAHTAAHETDQRDRVSGRRWLIGVGIAGVASMSAVAGLLVDVLMHIHLFSGFPCMPPQKGL